MQLDDPFNIGNVKVRNRVILAPMSGVSDLPFRQLAWKYGAGMVVSEMVASEAFVEGEAEIALKAETGNLPVRMVQLVGREPRWMGRAAEIVEHHGADIIDINMGCPSRRVTSGASGSALMRDLDLAMRLIEAVIEAVDVPVTLKMRLGWDHTSINAAQLAIRAQNAGISMLTVHGRTRCQFYKGDADWRAIAAVTEAVNVPVVVNGDIATRHDTVEAIRLSGATAAMIGRASYGAPWLPGQVANHCWQNIDANLFGSQVMEHYEAMLSFYPGNAGLRRARKHIGWYFDALPATDAINHQRLRALTANSHAEVTDSWQMAMDMITQTNWVPLAA